MPSQEPQGKPARSVYVPYDGGQGGNYVFADLDHLDRIITRWTALRDDLADDRISIGRAIQKIAPPADDRPSVTQAKAAGASLHKGQLHNQAMVDYVNGYIEKLQATRARYAAIEETNADTLRNADEQR